MQLSVHRVADTTSSDFHSLVDLYCAAHPASELKPLEQISSMAQRPDYLFLTAHLDGSVVGFAIVNLTPQTNASILEYMGIAEQMRGHGIGQYLFQQITEMPEVFGRFLLIEVDSDKEPSPLRDENSRRKRFYRNLGCREVASLDYVMPPVTAHAPPAMDIMAFGRPLPKAITKVQLLEWLQSIYVNEYGLQATDIRIEQMLGNLPETIDLQ